MTTLHVPGDVVNALDHLAAYGMAAIVRSAGNHRPRISWTADLQPRLTLDDCGTWEEVGETVHAHATRHCEPDSWVQADGVIGGKPRGLFSPRVSAMDDQAIAAWYAERHRFFDGTTATRSRLDLDLLGAIGEPSYWSAPDWQGYQDRGASRWELTVRYNGREFVTNYVRKVLGEVVKRRSDEVTRGLKGDTTAHPGESPLAVVPPNGLQPSGQVDAARAWCAVWGLSLVPVSHQVGRASRSAGTFDKNRQPYVSLPVMVKPTALPRLRAIIRSMHLTVLASESGSTAERYAASSWLGARGVPAAVRFPILGTQGKMPYHYIDRGELVLDTSTQR